MKQIEGLEIKDLAAEVIKEEAEKAKGPIKEKVRAIHINLVAWRKEREETQNKLKKLDEKIAKAEAKFKLLNEGGDTAWKALGDEKQNQGANQPKPEEEE